VFHFSAKESCQTPTLLHATSRGAVPYIIPDHLADSNPSAFALAIGDVLDCPMDHYRASPDGARSVYQLPAPIFLMHRVSPGSAFTPLIGGIPVADTPSGRKTITPTALGAVVAAIRPSVVVCPADQAPFGVGKRARTSVARTTTLFAEYLAALPGGSVVFAPVVGTNPDLIRESAKSAVVAAAAAPESVVGFAVLAHGGESPSERRAFYDHAWV
jgi:hypothetical protein